MGIFVNAIEKRYSLKDAIKNSGLLGLNPSATGINVSQESAMRCVPYFAGVRLIAETLGNVPLIEYRRINRVNGRQGKERATDRLVYYLLHDEPNPEMGAIDFIAALAGNAVTWGNAFAEIEWDQNTGAPRALWPLNVSSMKVGRDEKTSEIFYIYTLPDGQPVKLPPYRVWHLKGFGGNGLVGYDLIHMGREALGMSLAMEKFGATFFGNGLAPSGVLEHPNALTPEATKKLRESWYEMHQGLENHHRMAILEEGMKYHQITIPPDNAQYLESRKFQLVEIARLLHIPPHMLADLDRATFANIEHQTIEFNTYTMGPWYRRWSQTCYRKLLVPQEKQSFFFEFLEDALLKADSAARAAFYRELFYMGSMSPNDIREKENMNPINDPGGDKYYIQQNMVPMEQAGKQAGSSIYVGRSGLGEAVRTIAWREKVKLENALQRLGEEGFRRWLKDFYRDFPEYIRQQAKPVLGEGAEEFTQLYIEASLRELEKTAPGQVAAALVGWEMKKEMSIAE